MITVLFPASYFCKDAVDEQLKKEYDAVCANGKFNTALFSYDKFIGENELILNKECKGKAVYRGFMMKPEQYFNFYNQLKERGINLITNPQQYEKFHLFPSIYPRLKKDTAQMLVYSNINNINLNEIKQHFSKFIVKDFVKSVKGTSFPKFFTSSVTEEEFYRQMQIFMKFRGNLYTGGICIKEYLPLKKYAGATNEYRVFYLNNQILSVEKNSGQSCTPVPPKSIIGKYKNLASPYYTIDFAQIANGSWKIIEAGDGQVSGLSDFQDYREYFNAMYNILAAEQ